MPVSVVVGGQYGSEGKGKVALEIVRRDPSATMVVRPGGTNSGHTAISRQGKRIVVRQLPAAAIDGNVKVVIPPGAYIDPALLEREIALTGINPSDILIDPRAQIISREHIEWERHASLIENIGSTGSGTGAAVISRVARFAPEFPKGIQAGECSALTTYIADTAETLSRALAKGERIVVEGTQGFGLSPLHGDAWPKCTSRDTTAAAFLSESGLSPIAVDQIVLVIRSFPIRVAGDSGPLYGETTWDVIAENCGAPHEIHEFTSVTQKLRRVGLFDDEVVKRAIFINGATHIALNHLDYVDWGVRKGLTKKAEAFLYDLQVRLGRAIGWIGTAPDRFENIQSSEASFR